MQKSRFPDFYIDTILRKDDCDEGPNANKLAVSNEAQLNGIASKNENPCTIAEDVTVKTSKKLSTSSSNFEKLSVEEKEKLPAWVFCTRYSDRPCAGPRSRKRREKKYSSVGDNECSRLTSTDRRERIIFTHNQIQVLETEFSRCQYLSEDQKQILSENLQLTIPQIKVWFQNKRAKLKKSRRNPNRLALDLKAQGLYDHT
uniref:homeobox protein engrailed-1-B-like n=1 Tax=Styela clava TaxID=7725 RepID=UPI00193AD891|nr:homeobox protein engrailed-1-B-like [Styela clava]